MYNEQQYTHPFSPSNLITLNGHYYIEGTENIYPLPEDRNLNLTGHNNVIIEGNFSQDIPLNQQLIMRIDNMQVKIFINNKLFYTFGEKDTFVNYETSAGNLWCSAISPGINTTDHIRIELYNVYTDHVKTTFSSFLQNIYVGYEGDFILAQIKPRLINSFISIFIFCLGLTAIGLALVIIRLNKSAIKLLTFGGLCTSSGIWFFIDFNIQNYLVPYPVFNNSLDILSLLFSMFFLITYFALYLRKTYRFILLILSLPFLGLILITTFLQFSGIQD